MVKCQTSTTQIRVSGNVRALMSRAGHRQEDLAEVLGQSRANVGFKLNNRAAWSLEDLDRLADLYGVDVPFLVSMLELSPVPHQAETAHFTPLTVAANHRPSSTMVRFEAYRESDHVGRYVSEGGLEPPRPIKDTIRLCSYLRLSRHKSRKPASSMCRGNHHTRRMPRP